MARRLLIAALAALLGLVASVHVRGSAGASPAPPVPAAEETLRIGSKRFTESYILAGIAAATARRAGARVTSLEGLGGTALVFRALEEGSIDLYPEYTGTVAEAILHGDTTSADVPSLRRALAPRGIGVSDPLGFDDTYALAVPAALAAREGLRTISDLTRIPGLRFGLSPEFLGRSDGFPGLAARYGLSRDRVQALDHGLAYEAVASGSVDVVDVYSTDAKIARYHLLVLEDDRRFFPAYQAVFLYREDARLRAPQGLGAVLGLAGAIDASTMIDLNARAELEGQTFASVAEGFVARRAGAGPAPIAHRRSLLGSLVDTVRIEGPRHLGLVGVSLFFAVILGVPLGIAAARTPRFGRALLGATGVVQTIPSLALLCFFIPFLGTGVLPALAALFLYGLLPIARNTAAGIEGIPPPLAESAEALGLSKRARLLRVELPLASRTILAGIKTSAVINVGTATLAAFIGAGGFGAPISTGLNLNDTDLILAGAIPAALLAVAAEGLFAALDRLVIPRGLRLPPAREGDGSS
jgi:osmoprotectant transport system permease protein